MTKETAVQAFNELTYWLPKLEQAADEVFFAPIAPGKWTMAALIVHFRLWDEYFMEKRLPLFLLGGKVESSGIDVDEINQKAIRLSKAETTRSKLISETVSTRTRGIKLLQDLTHEAFQHPFEIGAETINLSVYIQGLHEHDEHHRKQLAEIVDFPLERGE